MRSRCSALVCLLALLLMSGGQPAAASTFGINVHTAPARVIGEVAHAGIGWVRIDLVWAFVEPEQDIYDWALYDRLLDDLEARGLRIFATLQGTPQWATDGEVMVGAPRDTDDWRDVCFLAANRYRGRVHAWGLWNEPNHVFFDGSRYQYTHDILLAGAAAVRAADPDALLCGPELAHLQSADWDDWLHDVVRDTRHVLDVVTHHVYPDGADHSSVTDALAEGSRWPWEPSSVRKILDDAGWSGRPFWLTETGADGYHHGEAAQASFFTGLLADWFRPLRTHTWMDRVFFYQIHDDPRILDEWYGVLSAPPELRRRPAYEAYQEFIANAQVDDGELVAAEVPAFAWADQPLRVRLELRNTGTTEWRPAYYRLVSNVEPSGWTMTGGALDARVAPRATAVFELELTPPPSDQVILPASFTLSARMDRYGRWLFGDQVRRAMVLTDSSPPVVFTQPQPVTVAAGGSARLEAGAVSPDPERYRWRRNSIELDDGDHLSGASSPVLLITGADRHASGVYDCVVTNGAGSVITEPAVLRVIGAGGEAPRDGGRAGIDPALLRAWHELRARARQARGAAR